MYGNKTSVKVLYGSLALSITAAAAGMVLFQGCAPKEQRTERQVDVTQTANTLAGGLDRNVSEHISNSKAAWTNRNGQWPYGSPMNWNLAFTDTGFDFLTPAQKKQLGGWYTPEGNEVNVSLTFMDVLEFDEHRGRMPSSGLEVVQWVLEKYPKGTAPNIATLPVDKLPYWYYRMVNPQTGRLYKSFDGSSREPGALTIRRITDKEDAKRAWGSRSGWELFDAPGCLGAYEIIVAAEDPTQVLDTATVRIQQDLAEGGV